MARNSSYPETPLQPPEHTGPAAGSDRATASRASGSSRDPFFDNAKYLAIVLVACAHSWEPFRTESRAALALYDFVYTFHMPAFIVISGYFSRTFDFTPRKVRRLVTGVLVPYVVFEVLYTCFRWWAGGDPDAEISVIDPWFLDWFLIALFLWRLTAPLWRNLRWPVPIAVAVSVLSAMTPDMGASLDMQRVLQFLPFFVLGMSLKPEHFERLRERRVRIAALPVAAAALVFAYWAAPRLNWDWFYRKEGGPDLGVSVWTGGVMALALFGCSLVLTGCFLAWVPRRRMWFTVLGAGTLYGYLLHGFLIKGSRFWGWYDHEWPNTPLGMVVFTVAAAVVITALCTTPVRRVFRFLIEPRLDWIFRTDPLEAARKRVGGGNAAG